MDHEPDYCLGQRQATPMKAPCPLPLRGALCDAEVREAPALWTSETGPLESALSPQVWSPLALDMKLDSDTSLSLLNDRFQDLRVVTP